MSRVEEILRHLDAHGVAAAMIGGAALAVYGVARATLDVDLLAADAQVLDPAFWQGGTVAPPAEIRRGDDADPLLGLVRWTAAEGPVDLVVGRGRFMASIVARRVTLDAGGFRIPVVEAADLILLKLAAGGPQDLLDVRLMLEGDPGTWRATVAERVAEAPREVRESWERLSSERS